MSTGKFELAWRCLCILLALIVLPAIYIWILARLHNQKPSTAPRYELFVGFGTVGGWLLTFALLGSGPLIILPLYAWQYFIAMPFSVFCLFRLARRAAPSGYRTTAIALLTSGIVLAIGIVALSCLWMAKFQ
jgi:Na+-translocating ferredoxin:NAD+ oxidoreductase RnfD subunit